MHNTQMSLPRVCLHLASPNCPEATDLHSYESSLNMTGMSSTFSNLFMTIVVKLVPICLAVLFGSIAHSKPGVPALQLCIHLQEASHDHSAAAPCCVSQPLRHPHVVSHAGRMSISVHVENSLTSALQHSGRHALQTEWMSTRRTCLV